MDLVRLCPVCEYINPSTEATRCSSCWAFLTETSPISRTEAERRVSRVRIPIWRRRYLLVTLAVAVCLVVWRVEAMFDVFPLLFPPSSPKSGVSADTETGNWAQVRRSPNSTGYTPEESPAPRNIKWIFDAGEPLTSTVAVAGRQVFLSTERGRTLALDRDTGRIQWEYLSPFPSSSTPAVTGDLVVTALRPGKVVALDRASGNVRWETELGEPLFSSPVIVDGRVYIGATDMDLHGLDAATGEKHWKFSSDDWVNAPVSYDGDILAMASRATQVELVETRTARRRFIYDVSGARKLAGGPVLQGGLVHFGTQEGTIWTIDGGLTTYPFERVIRAIRVNLYIWDLAPLPVQKGAVWTQSMGGEMFYAPVVGPDTVYAAASNGKVTALGATTGEVRWVIDVDAEISSGLTVAGNTVLSGTEDGRVLGLNAASGESMWEFKTGGKITGAPVVAGGVIYVPSHDGKLYAVTGP